MKIKDFVLALISPNLRFRIVNFKNSIYGGYKKFYFSQNGEDVVAATLFDDLKIKNGFYVDVGAHHPQRYSNTNLLFLKGWSGINIDPNPETIRLFNSARKRDINLNVGVAENKSEITYYNFSDPAVNTFSAQAAKKYEDKKWISLISKTLVSVTPLREILAQHLPTNKTVDLLNIDVEGFDMEVLRSNDWENIKPCVIIIEDHLFDIKKSEKSEIYSFLLQRGYRLHVYLGFSLIFVREGI
jgi:FkbM family methyltransferase